MTSALDVFQNKCHIYDACQCFVLFVSLSIQDQMEIKDAFKEESTVNKLTVVHTR